ncbi:ribosomal L7Ae/L30e/S12e/Gadd45 family protein [Clostridium formicaceticum]|uniref:50S ribosomal protein L7 n=1 Tax=Clostridium formicaceticum TaxID=1497 RepID=A0AAC9WJZ8_9CLOT|nr:ribosomal L7Ae/L30e/S12e/Gadd45 family protein [Clostridium formicaceticum]AOY75110.1 50S ribosomal protein L7 [Clostridium formicaceticum]ARE89535.1 Ribosome-associated protein L7Ae-like protein [Clostridium formicaceticum]
MLDSLQKANNKVIGIKQTNKALAEDKVKTLYLAEDAEIHLLEKLKNAATSKGVEIIYVDSMKKLGKACSIDVSAAAAAILK